MHLHEFSGMFVRLPERHPHIIILNKLHPELANHAHHFVAFLASQIGSSVQETWPVDKCLSVSFVPYTANQHPVQQLPKHFPRAMTADCTCVQHPGPQGG